MNFLLLFDSFTTDLMNTSFCSLFNDVAIKLFEEAIIFFDAELFNCIAADIFGWKFMLINNWFKITLVSWGYSRIKMYKTPARMSTKCLGNPPLIPFEIRSFMLLFVRFYIKKRIKSLFLKTIWMNDETLYTNNAAFKCLTLKI